ncbi:uncharacterized protein BCR38DRAFT_458970 [Pseudomassariella vexata]|uniref:Kelch domain-containing protein n=1 Tax=Pseudomassariella vexata TaxID=1141098 RepID=A0A1Y2DUZ7_9PEZI|nr:uncharacterized protein BCR38DRAFT_458970 [Pseudomassariella vexata]ORY62475.1 hypothetical protein BCR38DRAFT_458970 [Pseudomassariella vexata]
MLSNIPKGRKSIFKEVGLVELGGHNHDDHDHCHEDDENGSEEHQSRSHRSLDEKELGQMTGLTSEPTSPLAAIKPRGSTDSERTESTKVIRWLSRLAPRKRGRIKASYSGPPPTVSGLPRLTIMALIIAIIIPTLSYNNGHQKVEMSGVDASLIWTTPGIILEGRADSPTDVCTRWAHQSAVLNGTLYIYGGESKSSSGQTTDTWNNDLVTLDLTKSWSVSEPAVSGLPQPLGPPAVALGYLWNDYNNLYLYGGEFADNPFVEPVDLSIWRYSVSTSSWFEISNPKTSAGNFSEPDNVPLKRAAEGAGISVPELGRSWYFGGHLDWSTMPGWSNQTERVYLRSLLEFTHPGYANSGVDSLHTSGAGSNGVYRNITQGGIQEASGFSERADGVLIFVPGWGPSGILLGLGGGTVDNSETSDTFSSMSTIDVYDIETSMWYHQETSGTAPEVRVNPCAVIFSAPDASSFNIYMYGGQNLLPVAGQTQYTDMWVLTIPSFTWIKVDTNLDDQPAARAGHTCNARDGQMVVVGGFVGDGIGCDSPGIYNFNASSLQWQDSFTAFEHPADLDPENSILAGSYRYRVPGVVQSVIGGSSDGGATATTPASGPATGGPFATGKPPVFTITASGSTATITSPSSSGRGSGASKGGLIAACVIAGLAGLLAAYLGFCAWLYRRQVKAYKRHMAVANRYGGADGLGFVGATPGAGIRDKLRKHRNGGVTEDAPEEQFGWVGQGQPQFGDPKWLSTSDEPTPGSGSGSGTRPRPSEDRAHPWGWFGSSTSGNNTGVGRMKSSATRSTASGSSTDGLMDGEPSFFSVVIGPRRALRVVNGMQAEEAEKE